MAPKTRNSPRHYLTSLHTPLSWPSDAASPDGLQAPAPDGHQRGIYLLCRLSGYTKGGVEIQAGSYTTLVASTSYLYLAMLLTLPCDGCYLRGLSAMARIRVAHVCPYLKIRKRRGPKDSRRAAGSG
jgi:hypothetical protein